MSAILISERQKRFLKEKRVVIFLCVKCFVEMDSAILKENKGKSAQISQIATRYGLCDNVKMRTLVSQMRN